MAIIDWLMNPVVLTTILIIVVIFFVIVFLRARRIVLSNKVITVLQPRDKRAFDLPITEETDTALICRKIGGKGVERRFYKAGPGWHYINGAVRFFGLEGKGYTAILPEGADKPKTMTLPNALKSLWGEEAYKKAPEKLREVVENHVFGVTIIPDKIPDDDKFKTISSENIDKENIKDAMDVLGKKLRQKNKMDRNTFIFGLIGGALIIYILCNMHIIPVV
jgi:hypothetical protein